MEQTLNAGEQKQNTQKPESKSFGNYAKDFGSTAKNVSGKALSVFGGVVMHSVITLFCVIIGMLVIDFLGLGLLAGGVIALLGALAIAYVGNGLQGGGWNPIEYTANTFA